MNMIILLLLLAPISSKRISGESFLFQMTRSNCLERNLLDDSPYQFLGTLKIDASLVGCPGSNGIVSYGHRSAMPGVYSSLTVASLSRYIGRSNITLEVWFRSTENFYGDTVLFAISPTDGVSYPSGCSYNLQVCTDLFCYLAFYSQ